MAVEASVRVAAHPGPCVVWIDHQQARILELEREGFRCTIVRSGGGAHHLHHKANSVGSGHLPEDQRYLHEVSSALVNVGPILLTGPANEKFELVRHVELHHPKLRGRIAQVRTVDHPTDGELVARAREFFAEYERTQAGSGVSA